MQTTGQVSGAQGAFPAERENNDLAEGSSRGPRKSMTMPIPTMPIPTDPIDCSSIPDSPIMECGRSYPLSALRCASQTKTLMELKTESSASPLALETEDTNAAVTRFRAILESRLSALREQLLEDYLLMIDTGAAPAAKSSGTKPVAAASEKSSQKSKVEPTSGKLSVGDAQKTPPVMENAKDVSVATSAKPAGSDDAASLSQPGKKGQKSIKQTLLIPAQNGCESTQSDVKDMAPARDV